MTIEVSAVQLWSDRKRTPDENRAHALEMLSAALTGGDSQGSTATKPEEKPGQSSSAVDLANSGKARRVDWKSAKRRRDPTSDFRFPPLDLVVLPEAVSMLCYPDGRADFTYRDVAEPVPGPTTERVAQLAAEAGTNVIVGLIADRGPNLPCQNVAVVIDRDGSIVGIYEKTHEPEICRREQAAGQGSDVPVFELDFGRIGIFVCWDLISPEIPQILADRGADLLCFQHLIALPTSRNFAVSLRARAVDTGLPIVSAGMRDAHNHNGSQDGVYPTCILDADGNVLIQSEKAGPDVIETTLSIGSADPEVTRRRSTRRPDLYAASYSKLNPREFSSEL